jgi:tripartite motif-containing protein 71
MGQTLKLGAVTLGGFALVVAMASTARAQCNPPCGTFLTKWGSSGTGDGQFVYPAGVAVHGSGHVFVVDFGNVRIQKFDSNGMFLTRWGSPGSGNGQFYYPLGVAVDGSGNFFVADEGINARIQKFDNNGTFLTKWGSYGAGNGQFTNPTGVAVDGSGNVFVSDWDIQCNEFAGCQYIMARIQKFTNAGTFLTTWGSSGSGDGQFLHPTGVAVDGSGNVYVADYDNGSIQKFTNSGTFLTKWAAAHFPLGLAVDRSAHVFVTDTDDNLTDSPARMEEFTNTGTFLIAWGSPGSGDGQFGNGGPSGVAVDATGTSSSPMVTTTASRSSRVSSTRFPLPRALRAERTTDRAASRPLLSLRIEQCSENERLGVVTERRAKEGPRMSRTPLCSVAPPVGRAA